MYKWGGPLDPFWLESQRDLQRGILAAMRAFGMTPVLPGWSGRVPQAIAAVLPGISLFTLPPWAGFSAEFSANYNVNVSDPLFLELGVNYTRAVIAEYGTDHLYGADLWNELDPPSSAPAYLRQSAAVMYESVRGADPAGIYVMQGWLFRFSPFWTVERARAFLGGLPVNATLVLELNTDQDPVFPRYDSFFGHAFVWNVLAVFGGRRGLYGNLTRVATGPTNDRALPNVTMVGFGATPEALDEIPLVFDLIWEMNWRSEAPDVGAWVQSYGARRYGYGGRAAPLMAAAMAELRASAYEVLDIDESPLEDAPSLTAFSSRNTNATGILAALRLFLAAAAAGEVDAALGTVSYDVTDLTRQVLVNLFDDYHQLQALRFAAYVADGANTSVDVAPLTARMLALLRDLDAVAAADVNFLLGPWIADARRWANTSAGADNRELNARNLFTLWGPGAPDGSNSINDYSARHYQGLLGEYYRGRWELQGRYMLAALASGTAANWTAFGGELLAFERAFSAATAATQRFPTEPVGEPLALAADALARWAPPPDDGAEYEALAGQDAAAPPLFLAWTRDVGALQALCDAAPGCAAVGSDGGVHLNVSQRAPRPGVTLYVKRRRVLEGPGER